MQLELEVDPDAVADVAGLRPLAVAREARPRTQTVKLVWHDSPDHALLSQGLTVVEQRDGWRLERMTPGAGTWLPGQPPPIVAAAGDRASLTADLPVMLAPVAAFEGRRTISVYRLAPASTTPIPPAPMAASLSQETGRCAIGAPTTASLPTTSLERPASATLASVTMTIERGGLRSVAAERPVARITLSGEDHAVRAAALMIAGAIPVAVPRASLAAQAFALAMGGSTAPRHLGAVVLPDPLMTVPDALAHILGHLTDVILHHAPAASLRAARTTRRKAVAHSAPAHSGPADAGGDNGGVDNASAQASEARRKEAVHQMRVAVRRALSAVSICRDALPDGTLDAVRDGLKGLGARLGQTRDWDVFVSETAPMIAGSMAPDERLDRLLAAAMRRRQEYAKALPDYLTGSAFRLLAIELVWFAAARFWHTGSPASHADSRHGGTSAVNQEFGDPSPDAGSQEAPDHRPETALAGDLAAPLIVRDFAPTVLQHRWKKLLSAGKRIEELDIAALHGVRLRAKRARYAAEMFAVAHDGKAAQRFIRRLSLLQQRLGVLNDGAVAAQLLQQLGGPSGRHAYAVGVVVGFTAARAAKMRPRIIRAFGKFRRQPIYWT